jgi:NADPH:quinone reductase-like Zn-dependent oxidoreductase
MQLLGKVHTDQARTRGMAARLNAFIDAHGIKPVIDRSFGIEQALDAYRYQSSSALFGKVVITL